MTFSSFERIEQGMSKEKGERWLFYGGKNIDETDRFDGTHRYP